MLTTRIKQLREIRGLDIGQLEALTSISAAHLYRIEKGERIPGADTLARLATGLETSADYLLGLSDDPNPRPIANHPALHDPRFSYLAEMWSLLPDYAQDHLARQVKLMEKLNPDLRAAMAERGWDVPDVPEK